MTVRDGIVRALAPESEAHFAGFIRGYERIREAEGRGSDDPEFYLGLPYGGGAARDPRQWHIRARSHDHVSLRVLRGDDRGPCKVLDLGAGNGWMSYRLALAGHHPCAVDLLVNDGDGLGAARHYAARLPALFPRVQASFGQLPFEGGQFDAAIFNASFHYAEDGEAALREALRCVKPGGIVVLSDSPWYPREEDGRRMLAEREAAFARKGETTGNGVAMLGFLTDAWLRAAERTLSIEWEIHRPWYGWAWALRPLLAKLRRRREPSRFRLYVARRRA